MYHGIKVYRINDFIRKDVSGEIDFDKSLQLVVELAAAANYHAGHNVLVDFRDTTTSVDTMEQMMKVVMEFVQYMPAFKNKIANVVPGNADRVALAEQFQNCMNIKQFHYKFFTDFEQAIEWLSDVTL